jgi:hypothetical protein
MSLDVPTALLERAEAGAVDDAEFVACVRDSLPYAWAVVTGVVADLRTSGGDAIRGGLERHFGVTLAFQNCHRVAAFAPSAVDGPRYREFISPRGQLLNQSPELRDC